MGAERAFDLERRDIDAADLEHVVAPPAIDVVTALILHVFVAGARPFAQEGLARALAVVPIHDRRRRPAHLQLAHFVAARNHVAVIVDETDVVARHRLAGGAVFHPARIVRNEDVQHLGGTDAVEHVDAVALLPAPPDVRRQGLTRGDAVSQLQIRALGRAGMGEEGGIECRHGIEHRHRMAAQDRGDCLRGRAIRREDGGGADRHGESHGVAEPVGEKELGHRIADVAFLEAEHTAGIEVGGQAQIGVDVHRALGPAGRARGIKPKAHVVARGGRGVGFGPRAREQILETAMPACVLARDDHAQRIRARTDQIGEFRKQRLRHHEDLGAAVGEHEAVVILGHERIDRNGHHAGLDGPEEGGGPVDGVEEREQDALLAPDSERAQHVAEAVHALGELAVGPTSTRIDIDRLVGAPGLEVALDDIGGEVVAARDRVDGGARIDRRRELRGGIGHGALPHISSSATKRLLLRHELCKPPMTVAMKSLL